jgi:hypothetical protein
MQDTTLAGASRSGISIPLLCGSFNGPVIGPGDPGFDEARALFYGGFEELRPAAIIRPADAAEVAPGRHHGPRPPARAGGPQRRAQ